MTYVKINGMQYPAIVRGSTEDTNWDDRASEAIKLEMTHGEAMAVFHDGAEWSIITEGIGYEQRLDEEGNPYLVEVLKTKEIDYSAFCLAGDVTDHRDGTVTVKMGKLTPLEEAYEIMLGGI